MTHDDMIAVLQAQKDGKALQYHIRNVAGCTWGDVPRGEMLNFVKKVYRINPVQPRQKKLRPWTENDIENGAEFRNKNSGYKSLVISVQKDGVRCGLEKVSWEHLLLEWETLDGEPCGEWE